MVTEIGTNSQLRKLVRSSRPSRSHKPKARKASATDKVKFTKPNRNGYPVMKGKAKKAVGGTRPWTSRATQRNPAAVSGGVISTMNFTAGSSPISLPSGMTRRSTPRLPIAAQ